MENCFVVGDYFADFLKNKQVVSIQEFLRNLQDNKINAEDDYIFGQGISDVELDFLRQKIDGSLHPKIFSALPPARAITNFTHKHKSHNSVVSVPRKLNESNYELEMVIDDQNDIMADHLTGQHIQGVLIIEAARQAWTAVTEKYYLADGNRNYRFIIEEIKSNFKHLVFPLPITIKLKASTQEEAGLFHLFNVVVDFYQCERRVAVIEASYKVVVQKIAEKQEELAGRAAISSLIRKS